MNCSLLRLFFVGADSRQVDTEDVAVKANELAPGRFSWRRYPDQINIEIVRAFLSDAKKNKYGAYLTGSGSSGWLLTEAGIRFAQSNIGHVQQPTQIAERLSKTERQRRTREQARIAASDAFQKFLAGRSSEVPVHDAEALFRLNEYIVGASRHNKVSRIVNTLRDDPEVGEAIHFFATIVLKETPL